MPVRNSIKTIATPEIQGDDSFVKYRPITLEEARNLRDKSKEVSVKQDRALRDYAEGNNKSILDLTSEDKESAYVQSGLTDDLLYFADQQLSRLIVEWNWVDDDGNPLPQPRDDFKVLGKLYTHEYSFLMKLFNPEDNSKN